MRECLWHGCGRGLWGFRQHRKGSLRGFLCSGSNKRHPDRKDLDRGPNDRPFNVIREETRWRCLPPRVGPHKVIPHLVTAWVPGVISTL